MIKIFRVAQAHTDPQAVCLGKTNRPLDVELGAENNVGLPVEFRECDVVIELQRHTRGEGQIEFANPDVVVLLILRDVGLCERLDSVRIITEKNLGARPETPDLGSVLAAADAGMNPVTAGGGSNVKVPAYLALGLAVISTAFGVRGYAALAARQRIRRRG
ncbi:MAG: hypothetical protein ABL878_20375 [Burkholderiales bacterium]